MVEIKAAYPAGVVGTTKENLAAAAAGEHEEWGDLYANFAEVAQEEGFPEIALLYKNIAKVEQMHEARYVKLLERLENEEVFKSEEPVKWYCRKCGYVVETKQAPKKCPVCGMPQAWFERFPDNY